VITGDFRGRDRDALRLERIFSDSESSLTHVTGPSGIGKTRLIREVLRARPSVHLHCPPFPAPIQVAEMARQLQTQRPVAGDPVGPAEIVEWVDLLDAIVARAGEGDEPFVVVLDDAHRLNESRARIAAPLDDMLRRTRRAGRPFHVVMAGPGGSLPDPPRRPNVEPGDPIRLGPLDFYEALPFLPGSKPHRLVRAYAVLGGHPGRLTLVDPEVSLGTNIRRLMLAPGGPLGQTGVELVERSVQVPSRYMAILSSLAHGEKEWSAVHDGVPDLSRSGQLAPYVSRLEELGLVGVDRSLDAGPRSRSRRYRILDPFLRFWFRFALPGRETIARGEGESLYPEIRRDIDGYSGSVFTEVCRDFMRRSGTVVVGSNARECGGLWGAGYDLPVSGLLKSGAAFYGLPVWEERFPREPVRELDRQVRETRYGFGRERRYRVVFHRAAVPGELEREAARRETVMLVGLDQMLDPTEGPGD